jgi:hypothetical protein
MDRVWSSAKKNGTGRAFERVWTPANNGTCHLVKTIVKRRTAVKEETTVTTVGKNAMAVAPMTKEEIKDRLHQKYITAQKINKKEYDDNPPYDCLSNEDEEKMLKELGIFEYPHGGIFANEHPIDLVTNRNLSFIDAFPDLELQSPQGRWVCPLSNKVREWRRKNKVSFDLKAHCGGNCGTNYDSCQSLKNHLRARAKKCIMHQYTLDFLDEWCKEE